MSKTITSIQEYQNFYLESIEAPETFWGNIAAFFYWRKKWDKILDWNFTEPKIEWFINGKLNITENCLDRHVSIHPDAVAIIWEPNDPSDPSIQLTYKELLEKVCQFASVLKRNGIKKGDRICIYMPMVPEAAIAMLACARIGAIHNVVFGGFSAHSLTDRINDSACSLVITSDEAYRGAKTIPMKLTVDAALENCPSVQKVIVFERTKAKVPMQLGRDVWWSEELKNADATFDAVEMDAEDMLFLLYTSGSTGKPKGVVHTIGGYMVYTQYTFENVFQYKAGDKFWCTADVGWITGHSYCVYGPLLAGATTVFYEGLPTFPDAGRFWQIIDKHQINILYTAPTAIRALESYDLSFVNRADLSSLKVLGSVGEPINEEAWQWYDNNIGKGKCPIVDTWWQTETGGILISPIAGITKTKPGFATLPLPGIQPVLVDDKGLEIKGNNVEGNLCIKFPWPSMMRTTYGDHDRFRSTYFSAYKGLYFTGDGCKRDAEGNYRITGRVDDVINVSGHRIGTAEVESAINMHPAIVESAVVGFPHDIKGQGIYAYVICPEEVASESDLRLEILAEVNKIIGPIAKPDKIQFVNGLPKTRSGKIMRRILRKIAEGEVTNLGDTSTLLDPGVVEEIIKGAM